MMFGAETLTPTSSTDGLILDYAALDETPVSHDPFTHLVVRHFLPPAALTRIHAELPRRDRGGSFPPQALCLGPATKSLMYELEGPVLRRAIAEKFDLTLDDAPSMLTVRLATREKDGQIHTDSRAKRVTALLYLNPTSAAFDAQDGCLRLMRSATDLEDYAVEVPPTDGTLLVFPNGPTSWHGHRTHVGQRYSVQLNYMTDDAKARTEMRRHRLSALIKRYI
jgi:SM-20-related protein